MKRTYVVTWVLALFAIILPVTAGADVADPSHFGLAAGMQCNTCHQEHRTLGKSNNQGPIDRPSPAVMNNMCQSCHRTGDGYAKAKPMALVDTSAIFGDHSTQNFGKLRQTSHRWDGTDNIQAAGARPPVQAAMTTNTNGVGNQRGRHGFELACSRCHSPHLAGAPGRMLRMGIENDQMCRDCHRSRDTETLALAAGGIPNNSKFGTHPVGVNYDTAAAKGNFQLPNPKNANPSNPTSDLTNRLTKGGVLGSVNFPTKSPLDPTVSIPDRNVVCSTCHGIHYTDSRSSTFDGASTAKGKGNYANLSSGDGYLLRTDRRGKKVSSGQTDNLNICTNCHSGKKSHNGKDQDIQCADCHGGHVDYDATNSPIINPLNLPNVFLVKRNVKEGGMPSKIYFRYTGSKREYRNAQGTGVCQGCHVVPEAGGQYPAEHDSTLASDCNKCHFHSSSAGSFSGSCGMCHGDPPTSATPGPGGLATPSSNALGGSYAGAHAAHVLNGRRMECNTCHSGYSDRAMPSKTIDFGFEINGTNVPGFPYVPSSLATYNNTNTLSNDYIGFTGSVGSGPNQTCSAIYCHGSTLTGGSNTTPSWISGASAVACGSCHGASTASPPTTGSHTRHAGNGAGQLQTPCASCHGSINSNHINGNVKWNLAGLSVGQYKTPSGRFYTISGSTGRLAPSAAYGTCKSIYCHSNGGPNGVFTATATVTWGGAALNCGSCHNNMATTAAANGGHFKHSSTGNTGGPVYDCSSCHLGYTATVANGATHANKTVELMAVVGYSKPSPMPASTAWGTCSTNQCHGQATGLVWNNGTIWQTGGDRCSTCHSSTTGVTAGTPFYSTEYPAKQALNTNAKVGAHTYHIVNSNMMSRSFVCADCHGTVTLKGSTHMDKESSFSWSSFTMFSSFQTKKVLPSYNQVAGTCSNYCHGSRLPYGDTTGTHRNPLWSSPFMPGTLTLPESCNGCHGFPPTSATGHPASASNLAACKGCHPNVNSTAPTYANVFVDKSLHIDGKVQGGGCNGCHGYPPSRKSFTGSIGNWADAKIENYTSGGGSHTVDGHIPSSALQDQGWVNCTKCHNENDHATSAILQPSNVKVTIDPQFKFNKNRTLKYENDNNDANHKSGSCANVSCHYQKTPKWN